jgi:hypothetical protein
MKRSIILAVICCIMNTMAWGQTNREDDTLRYKVNPQPAQSITTVLIPIIGTLSSKQ